MRVQVIRRGQSCCLEFFLIKVKNRRKRRKCLFSLMYKFLSGSCLFVVCSKNRVSLPWHMDQADNIGFKFSFLVGKMCLWAPLCVIDGHFGDLGNCCFFLLLFLFCFLGLMEIWILLIWTQR